MTLDVAAIGAHPDDIELGCGGTLALLAAAGRRVGILHLTSGEAGTRGSAETRRREATAAAEILGAESVDFLDCGDAALRTGVAEENSLIAKLREWTPQLVLAPPPRDRHPDHGRAHRLVVDACFYAGLVKRVPKLGAPHRPAAVFSYVQHDSIEPSFIVDVTAVWERKMDAISAYKSQFFRRTGVEGDPETRISSPDFWHAIEGRARHFGQAISTTFGEAFTSPTPLSVDDPWTLLPRGLR